VTDEPLWRCNKPPFKAIKIYFIKTRTLKRKESEYTGRIVRVHAMKPWKEVGGIALSSLNLDSRWM
jgi:hypothetical protein